ncbi:g11732 [Coccomyxa viridis]|uniref:G11732 protein n=1 Tax=Coccomyxa viridis TaxID=1274662 RepID=A0ABP1G8L7_9CHLO
MLPSQPEALLQRGLKGCFKSSKAAPTGRKSLVHRYKSSGQRSSRRSCQTCARASEVALLVEPASNNARKLFAGVDIAAPVSVVWESLTDYDGLGTFIPGLAENRCLQRKQQGAKLLQIGEQEVAFGAKFRARVVLDIEEFWSGVPASMCESKQSGSSSNGGQPTEKFLEPRCLLSSQAHDITFTSVEGDFQAFRGIWRMKEGPQGEHSSRLSYSLFVRPQIWLPVRLVQGRIENEIKANLSAVRLYAESKHAKQGSALRQ